uniref:Uncharacterized protein n=1 Tax=Oryza punctata TaxID=4537 RepID=A0A0E0L166_ORYPU
MVHEEFMNFFRNNVYSILPDPRYLVDDPIEDKPCRMHILIDRTAKALEATRAIAILVCPCHEKDIIVVTSMDAVNSHDVGTCLIVDDLTGEIYFVTDDVPTKCDSGKTFGQITLFKKDHGRLEDYIDGTWKPDEYMDVENLHEPIGYLDPTRICQTQHIVSLKDDSSIIRAILLRRLVHIKRTYTTTRSWSWQPISDEHFFLFKIKEL